MPDRSASPRCYWPVRVSRVHTWRCTEPWDHDGDHAIRDGAGRITASSAGYSQEPADAPHG